MAGSDDSVLSHAEYWDGRYKSSADVDAHGQAHEWFRSFASLEPFLREHLFDAPGLAARDEPAVLHLGSGDSHVPSELAARGYRRQLCVDFSAVVVAAMSERHRREGIEWECMDVRDMHGLADRSVDLAFDKGTLDAMVHGSPWSPPDEVWENTGRYLREVHRVLKDTGVFLYITFRQPHFVRPLLDADKLWDLDMRLLGEGGSFDYYGFVLRKCLPRSESI